MHASKVSHCKNPGSLRNGPLQGFSQASLHRCQAIRPCLQVYKVFKLLRDTQPAAMSALCWHGSIHNLSMCIRDNTTHQKQTASNTGLQNTQTCLH